jgi:hypothetical protein
MHGLIDQASPSVSGYNANCKKILDSAKNRFVVFYLTGHPTTIAMTLLGTGTS